VNQWRWNYRHAAGAWCLTCAIVSHSTGWILFVLLCGGAILIGWERQP
jgi:hypothetical protein